MIFIGKYRNSSKHEATKDRRAMGERESERETDRQTDRETERERERQRGRERECVCVCVSWVFAEEHVVGIATAVAGVKWQIAKLLQVVKQILLKVL